jgi:hypothetical protein
MDSCRLVRGLLAVSLVLCAFGEQAAADSLTRVSLKNRHQPNELTRVEIALQVGGDLKLMNDGKAKDLPMSVVANLKYDELLLTTGAAGHPSRTARFYDDSRAVIKVEQGGEKPALAPERRLIVAEKLDKQPARLYCPQSPLKREELDLIDVPGNSLLVDGLLPDKPVAQGESWKLSDDTLADLLGLDAVSWSDVTSVLGETKDGVAEIASAGSISAAVAGVATEIELKAKYRFDLGQERLIYVALLIKEKRAVGHVGPGLDTVAKVLMSITPIASSNNLTPERIAQAQAAADEVAQTLSYAAASGQFQFEYDRRWFLTSDDKRLTVLRLLDRGELVAQCNISLLPAADKKPVSLAEFQSDVQKSLGKNFGKFTSASQNTSPAGYAVLRVVAQGVVGELPIEWVYYLVADPQGKRVSLAFTYEQNLGERFGQADRALVNQLRMTEPPAPTAARPRVQQ